MTRTTDLEDLDPRDYPEAIAALIRAAHHAYVAYSELDAIHTTITIPERDTNPGERGELYGLAGDMYKQVKAIRAAGEQMIAQHDKLRADDLDVPASMWYACPACKTGLAPVEGIEGHAGLIVECGCGRKYKYDTAWHGLGWYVSERDEWRPVDLAELLFSDLDDVETKAARVEQLPYRSADSDDALGVGSDDHAGKVRYYCTSCAWSSWLALPDDWMPGARPQLPACPGCDEPGTIVITDGLPEALRYQDRYHVVTGGAGKPAKGTDLSYRYCHACGRTVKHLYAAGAWICSECATPERKRDAFGGRRRSWAIARDGSDTDDMPSERQLQDWAIHNDHADNAGD